MTIEQPHIARWLLDIQAIYLQPDVNEYPRGWEILEAFPDTERVLVDSHWKIPGLYGFEGNVDDWIHIKRTVLVLGIKSSLSARPNTRSSDFVAPSHATVAPWPAPIATFCAAKASRTRLPNSSILSRSWLTPSATPDGKA